MMHTLRSFRDLVRGLSAREEGQGMVEYVLIIGTVSLVIVAAFLFADIGGSIEGLSTEIVTRIGF